jgi:hypothetical protein
MQYTVASQGRSGSMLDVSFPVAWLIFLILHLWTNTYIFFIKSKLKTRYFFVLAGIVSAVPALWFHWHYGIVGIISLTMLLVEKRILKKIILLNNITATIGVFFVISGGFDPIKLLLLCIMLDYAIEFSTIILYKWVIQRRKSYD